MRRRMFGSMRKEATEVWIKLPAGGWGVDTEMYGKPAYLCRLICMPIDGHENIPRLKEFCRGERYGKCYIAISIILHKV